jgi:hypothetical protein
MLAVPWLAAALLAAAAPAPAAPAPAAAAPAAAAPAAAANDAPTVAARADRKEARVGDVVLLTVTVVGSRQTKVNLRHPVELTPFVELDEANREIPEEKDLGDGKMRREWTLKVAAYEPGELNIPPVELTYLGKGGELRSARTEPVPVKITSLLANEPEPALKDIAPPVRVMERDLLLLYVAAGLGAAALGGVVTVLVRRKLRARALLRPPPPARPPHEIALERLDRLGAGGFADDADHRPFTFELSEVIRDYLGARFGFDSLELTTEELVAELHRRAAGELVMGEIDGWLAGCDLVKFAKVSPSANEARGALETAIRIVESTRPRPQPLGGGPAAPGDDGPPPPPAAVPPSAPPPAGEAAAAPGEVARG